MADADLILLPWVRRGAAAGVDTVDTLRADQPGLATAPVSLAVNAGPAVSLRSTLMGPGHVTGLDGRQVIRTDPAPGSRSFEPNYFPLVELDEPALPWLFTPLTAGAQSRLRPWLCLVVVRQQPGVRLDPPQGGPLPVLRIAAPARVAVELPDLADSWAWVHAQVTGPAGGDLAAGLATPERSLARLLCPRILTPDTDYLACVVPAFELGRLAGLGQPVTAADEAQLQPAWKLTAAGVELPVYYSWTFATGSGGDFQSLAMLLRARPLPAGVGVQPVDVGHSGLTAQIPPDTRLPLAGALQPVGVRPGGWPTPTLAAAWETALAPVLNAPAVVTTGDPLLAPPLYGGVAAGLGRLDPAHPGRWFEQLNLSPTHRAVAHLGTRVVQQLQDQLMASAWAQVADLERANQLRRQFEFGWHLAISLHQRHFLRMAPELGLQVFAPAQARMTLQGGPFAAALAAAGLPATAYATTLRRIARPRGALNRRVQAATTVPVPPTTAVLGSLQPAAVNHRHVVFPAPPGAVTLAGLASALDPPQTDFSWSAANAEFVTGAEVFPTFAFMPSGVRVPPRGIFSHRIPGPTDDDAAILFRQVAAANLTRTNPSRTDPVPRTGDDGSLADAFAQALASSAPAVAFTALGPVGRAATLTPVDATGTVRLAPRFPQPMSQAVADLAQALMLPGLDLIPPNTVVPLETNSAFVEAFLVGLNTELGRELLWRGFPADLTATYADRFWDHSSSPERRPDIDPVATWGDRALGAGVSTEDFVLLLRSELLRRFPDAVVYAVRAGEERHPVFTGSFAPDVRYLGFDIPAGEIGTWSIVLMEHPSAPRFGIEVGTDTGSSTHLTATASNAATAAHQVRQLPVRFTIPATVLLGRS